VNRRSNVKFEPKATIDILKLGDPPEHLTAEQKKALVHKYMEVILLAYIVLVNCGTLKICQRLTHSQTRDRINIFCAVEGEYIAGMPDFSWCYIPNREKYTK
jgi:hypothetical protein